MKKIYQTDPWLAPFKEAIDARQARILGMKKHIAIRPLCIAAYPGKLSDSEGYCRLARRRVLAPSYWLNMKYRRKGGRTAKSLPT